MKRDDTVYLIHILKAISFIEAYTQGLSEKDFQSNNLVQDGTIRQIQIIGEVAKNLSSSLRVKYPHVPWRGIAGMKDKLVHNYFGVDIDSVWAVIEEDIPTLKKVVMKIIKDLNEEA